jgi:hypothetical protein
VAEFAVSFEFAALVVIDNIVVAFFLHDIPSISISVYCIVLP